MSGPDDLVTDEGVDEGSAASSSEGDAGPDPDAAADVVGEPPHGAPDGEATPAGPVDTESPESRRERAERGTGQQLQEGEG